MNLQQLKYFLAAADAKSISQAAKLLDISQPSISRQIFLLEQELDVELFLRTNKGIELTDAGRMLCRQSRDLLQGVNNMKSIVQEAGSGVRGHLKIGTLYSDTPILLEKLHLLRRNYPHIELYIRHGTPFDLTQELQTGELNLLFLRTVGNEADNLNTLVLGEDPLELIMHRDLDPAPEEDEISIDLLRDAPMCLLRTDDFWGYNEYLLKECQRHGFTPNIVCQCYDTPMTMLMVSDGFGLSYQPRSIVQTLHNPDVYAKPIRGFYTRSFPTLVWNADTYLSPSVKLFLSLFKDGQI